MVPSNEPESSTQTSIGFGQSERDCVFDHAVLNVHYGLDEAETLFSSLGFTLSPRGYHSLGSINHLIVFENHYLELIGLDAANPNPRKELLEWPVGLNGIVYGSDDINTTRARLLARSLPVREPRSFSRPISLGAHTVEARFRTVTMASEYFPASRLYFCQHLTPELVWRDPYLQHPNSAQTILRLMVAAADPQAQSAILARAVAPEGATITEDVNIEFLSESKLSECYGGSIDVEGSLPRIAGMRIGVCSLDRFKAALDSRWRRLMIQPDRQRLIVPAGLCFGVMIEIIECG